MAGLRDNTLRIVLVGKTGSGKSATGNTILGESVFDSRIGAESVTKSCQKKERTWKGRQLIVVDTPGLFDTKENLRTTCEKVTECVILSSPGPHAIILVIQLGRFTEEEHNTVELVKAIFGEHVVKHMIILFTRKEELEGQELSTFTAESDERLKTIIEECELRCCAFNNRSADEAEKEAQVQELVELIEVMVQKNGGAHFSDSTYKYTEKALQRVEEAVKKIYATYSEKKTILEAKRAKNVISKEALEKEIKVLYEQHVQKVENAKKEAEKNIFVAVLKKIWSVLSNVWHKFWE